MGTPLTNWFKQRGIDWKQALAGHMETDMQMLPLFPVLEINKITSSFVQWLFTPTTNSDKHKDLYISATRLSSQELNDNTDLAAQQTQRERFNINILPVLANNHENSVFYQLDLEEVAKAFATHSLPLPPALPDTKNTFNAISDAMFRCKTNQLLNKPWQQDEAKAFSLLKEAIINIEASQPVNPKLALKADQIVWGRCPVRMDLAGGWTDTPPHCMLNGGSAVNIAIELNGQAPIQCFAKPCPEHKIILRSIDLGSEEHLFTYNDIEQYSKVGSAFSIPRAALALSGFSPVFGNHTFDSLAEQLKNFGSGLEITTLCAVPKGSGLGTSSILSATILGTLSEACNLGWDKIEIGKKALAIEQLLTTGGGWQDQFGGVLEGVKFLTTQRGFDQTPLVRWISDKVLETGMLKQRMLLYYTGITRVAKNILSEIVRGMFLNSAKRLAILNEIEEHALYTFEELQKGNDKNLGNILNKSWKLNQLLDPGTNTPEIQVIIDRVAPYIDGLKLLGAGGGGFMVMLAKDAQAAATLKEDLAQFPPNPLARFVEFSISRQGLMVTKS
ncbi:MAG: hypothetical protein HC896_14665 [Bacteroidales bacterium]|nr:hypothetical protein [Bacteroidales bacterium]